MFSIDKKPLREILERIKSGKIQLPDFQRDWVWDDSHITSLLASISSSYPIGAIMLYETGSPVVRFKPRPVTGVALMPTVDPEWLILDGQQRLTTLYRALFCDSAVATKNAKGKSVERRYYLDIRRALDTESDREDAIISIPANRQGRNSLGEMIDYSTVEKECMAGMFPLSRLFDNNGQCLEWQMKFLQETQDQPLQKRVSIWNLLSTEIFRPIREYLIPVIGMDKETPKEAICQVFEKLNTGGVPLSVFELLTATFAADDFDLRADWKRRRTALKRFKVLGNMAKESGDFLQVISLLATRARGGAITCKRKDLLDMSLNNYKQWADKAQKGFEDAARFMHEQCVYDAPDLPYRTQLVPLAAILTELGDKGKADGVRRQLAHWYWCGVFGELYGGSLESRFARDLPEVLSWVDNGEKPDTVNSAVFSAQRLYSMRTRNSAAYKGIFALLMQEGSIDFGSGQPLDSQKYFDDNIDIHHVFPVAYCKREEIDQQQCDSIVNKTPISAKTNRFIKDKAPEDYIGELKRKKSITDTRMDEILQSHLIDLVSLCQNNFDAFFNARKESLLRKIEEKMGKPVQRDENEESDWGEDEDSEDSP